MYSKEKKEEYCTLNTAPYINPSTKPDTQLSASGGGGSDQTREMIEKEIFKHTVSVKKNAQAKKNARFFRKVFFLLPL